VKLAHLPFRNLSQLTNLILAVGFSVKVEIAAPVRAAYLALRQPLGDLNAEEGGEIHYWVSLGCLSGRPSGTLESFLGPLRKLLGFFWRSLGSLLGLLEHLL